MIDILIDVTLLTFLAVSAVAIVRQRNLFAVIMLFGIFSFLSAGLFVVMDAADVAFTEAAVGAGISTVLMLATLALTGGHDTELPPFHRPWLPLLVVLVTGSALIYGTLDIAPFGDPTAPSQVHVAPDYLTRGPVETGMPNVVTSVLASYRGFDTLGETTVIFTACISVLLLIGRRTEPKKVPRGRRTVQTNLVLRVVSKFLIPLILLFALYVQFHGDYGPGGGFQAGVIFASAFILYTIVFGLDATLQVAPPRVLGILASCGVLIYAGTGVATLLAGGSFLDYSLLAGDPVAGQHLGILLIELGVGITVASVMILIFVSFAGRNVGK